MSGRGRGRGRGRGAQTGGMSLLQRSAQECGLDANNLRALQDLTRAPLYPAIELHSNGGGAAQYADAISTEATAKKDQKGKGANPKHVKAEEPSKPKTLATVKRSAATISLISKSREIHHRIQSSVFYVRPSKEIPDIVRFSDKKRVDLKPLRLDASNVLRHCLGGRKRTCMGRFVPEELVSGQRTGSSGLSGGVADGIAGGKALSLEDLEAKEKLRQRRERMGLVDNDELDDDGNKKNLDDDDLAIEQEDEEEEEMVEDYGKDHYASEDESDGGGDNEQTY
mmetsp:Transcript_8558/g.8710  ORF Transcript_8558/g.8710 Transcript_8558/m.8710 type:complete len:282 (-) Transcript_8558:140-985(-)